MYRMIDRSKNRSVWNTSSNKNHWASKCKYHWIYDLRTDESGLIDYQAFLHWIQIGELYRTTSTRYTRRAMDVCVVDVQVHLHEQHNPYSRNNLLCNLTRFWTLPWKNRKHPTHAYDQQPHTESDEDGGAHLSDAVFLTLRVWLLPYLDEVAEKWTKKPFSMQTHFEFQLTYLSIYFYPIDFDCLRPLDQNAHYDTEWDEYRRNIYKLLHLTALHFSYAFDSFFFFFFLSALVSPLHSFFFFLRCRHRCCRLLSNPFFFLRCFLSQQFYRCDVILNQIKREKKKLFLRLRYTRGSESIAQAQRQLLISIFHRFILTLHEHNFESCFLALRCNGTRVFETVKTYVDPNERMSVNASAGALTQHKCKHTWHKMGKSKKKQKKEEEKNNHPKVRRERNWMENEKITTGRSEGEREIRAEHLCMCKWTNVDACFRQI